MPLDRLRRQVSEVWEVPRDLALGRYPGFVTGGPLPAGRIPVFVFHSLEPGSFERKLRYLKDNRYVTLSADEYFEVLGGARSGPERGVVLTFDDGRGSVWSVGAPLLEQYGMKGIVFLIPGRVSERPGPPSPTWDDVRNDRARPEDVIDREARDPFLCWEEITALSSRGCLDFQSHTLSHAQIHTSPRLAGFMTPWGSRGHEALDVPWIRQDERDLWAHEIPLGTPLLRSSPRTSECSRFFEEPEVREACVAHVAAKGGAEYFRKAGWSRELARLFASRPVGGRSETPAEREAAIRRELAESRRQIEDRTGRPVTDVCYPWHVSGPLARRLAEETGYRAAFCGKVPGVPITLPGGDLRAIARVGEDYLERLPGVGRRSLASILYRKWRRRLGAIA
jgi:peptidoglycan/xylan/chitin deacetylase (PgdA/CDA1 family)